MSDDDLDGKLGVTGNEPPIFLHGSIADLTYRANKAGYPTISAWVDALEARPKYQKAIPIVKNGANYFRWIEYADSTRWVDLSWSEATVLGPDGLEELLR